MPKRLVNQLNDGSVISRLERAAKAAGFDSPRAMADALHDAGFLSTLNEVVVEVEETTLLDAGKALHQGLVAKDDPKHKKAFFKKLTHPQRGALVAYLIREGFAPANIAQHLGYAESTVRNIAAAYRDKLGKTVTGVRISEILGEIQLRAEHLTEAAIKKDDLRLAWAISKDKAKLWQDFGIAERAVFRQEHTHKMSIGDADIDKLIELREKKRAAEERFVDEEPKQQGLITVEDASTSTDG